MEKTATCASNALAQGPLYLFATHVMSARTHDCSARSARLGIRIAQQEPDR